jgi:hypothetical protein
MKKNRTSTKAGAFTILLLIFIFPGTKSASGHNGPLITVPVGLSPTFDASGAGFNDAAKFLLGGVFPISVKRDGDALWISVTGVYLGSPLQRINVYLDIAESGNIRPDAATLLLSAARGGGTHFLR